EDAAQPARSRPLACGSEKPPPGPRHGKPDVAALFRERAGGNRERFWDAGDAAHTSGIAGLAGHGIRRARLEPEGHPPAHRDVRGLPAVVASPAGPGRARTVHPPPPAAAPP